MLYYLYNMCQKGCIFDMHLSVYVNTSVDPSLLCLMTVPVLVMTLETSVCILKSGVSFEQDPAL